MLKTSAHRAIALAFMSAAALPACAADPSQEKPALQHVERLCFEPTYFIWGHSSDDENAWRVRYSFTYLLNPAPIKAPEVVETDNQTQSAPLRTLSCGSRRSSAQAKKNSLDFFFQMTGEFDFYAATRDSGPVINRVSNPALHARWILTKGDHQNQWWLNWIDMAAEHRSDGQVTEVKSPEEAARAQQAYDAGDHMYFDGVSRGANYTTVAGQWSREFDDDVANRLRVHTSLKQYWSRDSRVTWGPKANQGLAISDYDRMRITLTWSRKGGKCASGRANDPIEASAEWVLGDNGLKTQSLNLDFMYPCRIADWELPLYVRFHTGPMNTLSNYTKYVHAYWIGLKLYP